MIGALVGAGLNLALGATQRVIANHNQKKDERNRPQYQIPDEIKQNLNQAQQRSLQGLPEEQKAQYLSNLERGSAYSLGQISSRKGGLAGVATLNEQNNQGYQNLLSMDAGARAQNQDKLMGARQTMADYKDQAFQVNKVNPYYEHIARRDADNGALFQNISNSFGMALGGLGGKQNTNQMGQIGQTGNMYGYNPYSNQQGIVPDGYSGSNYNIG